ncbi:MAG TPA: hypothetical protein PKM94_09390, partial [candidate division Zixibacteria bacterium]|nr:hypothetical protein [candidate division Zixibacteria bacterium]
VFAVLAAAAWGGARAAGEEPTTSQLFLQSHQAGVRLGPWFNLGDMPPARGETSGGEEVFKTNFHDASFLFEGFYAHRLTPALMGELSLAILNRGSVTFTAGNQTNVGNVLVYAGLLQAKVYPLAGGGASVQPYLTAGGGLYVGRRSVQFTSVPEGYYYPNIDEETAAKISYAVGGGIDWPIASQIGLEINAKYCPIPFGKPLMTIEDYDGLAVSIGIKYLYRPAKDETDSRRRP